MPHATRQLHQHDALLWCLTINFWKKVIIKPPDEHPSDDTTSAQNTDMRYSCLQHVNFMNHHFCDVNIPSWLQNYQVNYQKKKKKEVNSHKQGKSLIIFRGKMWLREPFLKSNLFFKGLQKYATYVLTQINTCKFDN